MYCCSGQWLCFLLCLLSRFCLLCVLRFFCFLFFRPAHVFSSSLVQVLFMMSCWERPVLLCLLSFACGVPYLFSLFALAKVSVGCLILVSLHPPFLPVVLVLCMFLFLSSSCLRSSSLLAICGVLLSVCVCLPCCVLMSWWGVLAEWLCCVCAVHVFSLCNARCSLSGALSSCFLSGHGS